MPGDGKITHGRVLLLLPLRYTVKGLLLLLPLGQQPTKLYSCIDDLLLFEG